MSGEVLTGDLLGSTARWTAGVRAQESEREGRLFEDPWAAALAGEPGMGWVAQRTADRVVAIVLRTRFFDDFLMRITHEHGIRQVVLLAAGLDTRSYRLEWPAQTRLFELDQPEVLQHKADVLESAGVRARCERQAIGVDLTATWEAVLLSRGFVPGQPSAWLLEGLLFYLSNDSVSSLLDRVSGLAAPGSWMGFDVINSEVLSSEWTRSWVEMQASLGAPWIGTMDDPQAFLAERGWKATITQAGAPDANYGRWLLPVIPPEMPNMPHNWLVTAVKGQGGEI
jgi:methyltransferase (TIGR00027 family)